MADSSLKEPIAAAAPKPQGATSGFQWGKWLLVAFVFGYLALILLVPAGVPPGPWISLARPRVLDSSGRPPACVVGPAGGVPLRRSGDAGWLK